MHPLVENIAGVKPYTIFLKNRPGNTFSYPTRKEEKLFIELINKLKPKIVGFSVLSPYAPVANRLSSLIKENSPSTLVIWGGVHPTISPESCIEDIDMLCVGEGEETISELLECLREGKPYHSIKNLWVKNGKHIIKNPMRPLIQDLDQLPFPSYGNSSYYFIDSNRIRRRDPLLFNTTYWIQTSRGCPYVCSYCANSLLRPLFKDLGSYTRRRSVGNIIGEIKANNKTDNIFFVDEVFGSDETWLDEFEIQYKINIGLPFCAEYNPKDINATMLKKLSNAGLNTIDLGIQSGSDYIRNHIFCRPGKNSEIIKIAGLITDYKIKIKYDLIMDNPYDTEQSLKGAIEFLLQLPKPLFFNLSSLQYFPNYPLTKKAIKDKLVPIEKASVNSLIEVTTRSWRFVPRSLPYTNKQILQNIIWLIVENHAKDGIVKYAVFGKTSGSKMCLIYLNLKAIILGKIFGVGGIISRNYWIADLMNVINFIFKGNFKILYRKVKKRINMWIYSVTNK